VGLPRGLAPLRHPGFRLLASGQLTSIVGDALFAVALPWYVLAVHGGALLLATVLTAYGIPRTALVMVGGHAADRWQPWNVMIVADVVRAVAVGALGVIAALGPARAAFLVPIAVVLGAGEGLFLPGSLAIVPSLVPDEDLEAGNALAAGASQLALLAGPAVGGAAVALLGPASAFGADAFSFVVSTLTLAHVRSHQRRPRPAALVDRIPVGLPGIDLDGVDASVPHHAELTLRQLVASERVLQVVLIVTVAANLGSGGMSEVALPSLAHGPFHTGASGYGALIAAIGGGALLGTLLAAQARSPHRPAIVASSAFLAEAIFMALVPYLGGAIPAAGALAAFGALNGFGNIIAITAFQRWVPREHMGRLMGLLMLAGLGSFPVSVLLGGVVVHALGPAIYFPLCAAVLAVAVLGGLTQSSWRSFGLPSHQANSATRSTQPAITPSE
jgi:predicted MFS family arabinose efflux permease